MKNQRNHIFLITFCFIALKTRDAKVMKHLVRGVATKKLAFLLFLLPGGLSIQKNKRLDRVLSKMLGLFVIHL